MFSILRIFFVFFKGKNQVQRPGLKTISQQGFSICHWNLNSIFAHNFAKIFLLKAYLAIHKFDIICLSETYIDSSIPTNNDNLDIDGYNLVRSDHPLSPFASN